MISDELKQLMDSLAFTIGLILTSDDQDRHRIGLAYQEAQKLLATIPLDDIAAAGWMLNGFGRTVVADGTTEKAGADKDFLYHCPVASAGSISR